MLQLQSLAQVALKRSATLVAGFSAPRSGVGAAGDGGDSHSPSRRTPTLAHLASQALEYLWWPTGVYRGMGESHTQQGINNPVQICMF